MLQMPVSPSSVNYERDNCHTDRLWRERNGGCDHLKTKRLLCNVTSNERDSALAGIGNAEHDAQLQLTHEVVATVALVDMLPRLGDARVWFPLRRLP